MIVHNIRKIRKFKGVPAAEMAKELNLSPMGYSHVERGNVRLDVERLRVIARKLDVPEYIFFDDKLTKTVVTENTATYFCGSCGGSGMLPANFCGRCGKPLGSKAVI